MKQKQKQRLYDLLGENIRKFRTQQGLTQEQLAHKIDLTRTSIVNIEQGRQHPPLYLVFDLANALQVSLEELVPKEVDFTVNSVLNDAILKDVSEKDIEKLTSFLKEFMKPAGHHE